MPFDGSGNFVPLSLPDFPAIGGQPIYATQFNNVINDLIGGFGSVVRRDGLASMTGNLQMAGNKLTGLGPANGPGQALVYGQTGASLEDLLVTGTVTGELVGTTRPAGSEAALFATVTSVGSFYAGFNASGALSGVSTPSGGVYIGSPQAVPLYFGLGGAVRMALTAAGLLQIAERVEAAGGLSGEGMRVLHADAHLAFFNAAGTVRRGYLQFAAAGDITIHSDTVGGSRIVLRNAAGSAFLQADGSWRCDAGFVGPITGNAASASTVPWTGVTGRPTNLSQFVNDLPPSGVTTFNSRSGVVTLSSGDVTGALGYAPLSGITGGMVNAALGYTAYNAANPAGYISTVTSGMVTTALGYTPYNATNPSNYAASVTNVDSFTGTNVGAGYDMYDAALSKAGTVITLTRYKVYRTAPDPGGGDP